MLTRRQFFTYSFVGLGSVAASLGGYSTLVEPHWLETVERTLEVRGLPQALSGKRLVLLADIHVGPEVADAYVLDVFRHVASLEPDIVVGVGDFVTNEPSIFEHAPRIYEHLPVGKLATVGVLGNHDFGRDWSEPAFAERISAMLEARGMRVLRNEVLDVGGLAIVGSDDLWAGRFDPTKALRGFDTTRPSLALTHNPDTADDPRWGTFEGWILAGHTHGGQVRIPGFAPFRLPLKDRRYVSGPFDLGHRRNMYVSRGVGHIDPVRFNVRPEVTVFELRPLLG